MARRMIPILMIALLLSGCVSIGLNQSSPPTPTMPAPTRTVTEKLQGTSFTMGEVARLFKTDKKEVLGLLGEAYKALPRVWGDKACEDNRYTCTDNGLTAVFDHDRLMCLQFTTDQCNIDGISTGSDLKQAEGVWGKPAAAEAWREMPHKKVYEAIYRQDGCMAVLLSDTGDGKASKLEIWRDTGITERKDEYGIRKIKSDTPAIKPATQILNTGVLSSDLTAMAGMQKQQLLRRLGPEFENVYTGAESTHEGYYYPKYGITAVFIRDFSTDDGEFIPYENVPEAMYAGAKLSWIDCDSSKVTVNGVNNGMDFAQIQKCIGKGKVKKIWWETPDNEAYELVYSADKYQLNFFAFEKDGSDLFSLTVGY